MKDQLTHSENFVVESIKAKNLSKIRGEKDKKEAKCMGLQCQACTPGLLFQK
jgi:hypothetical protein